MDLGYDINPHSIMGIVGPKGVHPEIVETLRQAFKKAMEDPGFLRVGQQLDMPAYYLGPQELEKHIHEMAQEVSSIIQILGLRKE
jgi:tripartite-type tricarboxylate transporter receptor subunit TctC